MGFEVPVWPRSTIYCIFIVWMLSIREEERDTKGELSWACLQGDLAQAAVGRDSHQAKRNGAGQSEPDFFQ